MRRRGTVALAVLLFAATAVAVPAGARVVPVQSQRAWMRAHGQWPGVWVSRWGGGDGSLTRTSAKEVPGGNWAKAAAPRADCLASCHDPAMQALRRTKVTGTGFTNLQGNTPSYTGSLYPYTMLTDPRNTTKHAEIFRTQGCGGCHSPAAARSGGWTVVRGCQSCHNFSFLGWDAGRLVRDPNPTTNSNLHYHVIVAAEAPLSDPANAGRPACLYCHTFSDRQIGKASCWNCHLSGHWPQVAYWKEVG